MRDCSATLIQLLALGQEHARIRQPGNVRSSTINSIFRFVYSILGLSRSTPLLVIVITKPLELKRKIRSVVDVDWWKNKTTKTINLID